MFGKKKKTQKDIDELFDALSELKDTYDAALAKLKERLAKTEEMNNTLRHMIDNLRQNA